jgi:hypothetical protein
MSVASLHRAHHRRGALVAATLLVPVIAGLVLAAFVWPAARLAPRDLPIGVVGPDAAMGPIAQRLAERPGAFDAHRYTDQAAARAAVEDRIVYGAIVPSPEGLTLLTASAASPMVALLLQQAVPARVVDVVPADSDDPRGAALGASVLPLVLAGVLTGVIAATVSRPGLAQAGSLVAGSAFAGLVAVGLAQGWLSVFGGDWWVNAGVLGLTVLAISAAVAGLAALLGRVGLALGALIMVLIGNPFSGVSSAPELLPEPAGYIGQLLPPGAGGSLLRSTAFFDGAGAGRPLTVLSIWAALGLVAVAAGTARQGRSKRRATVTYPASTAA